MTKHKAQNKTSRYLKQYKDAYEAGISFFYPYLAAIEEAKESSLSTDDLSLFSSEVAPLLEIISKALDLNVEAHPVSVQARCFAQTHEDGEQLFAYSIVEAEGELKTREGRISWKEKTEGSHMLMRFTIDEGVYEFSEALSEYLEQCVLFGQHFTTHFVL